MQCLRRQFLYLIPPKFKGSAMKKRIMAVFATMLIACAMVLVCGCNSTPPQSETVMRANAMPPVLGGDPDEMKAATHASGAFSGPSLNA